MARWLRQDSGIWNIQIEYYVHSYVAQSVSRSRMIKLES